MNRVQAAVQAATAHASASSSVVLSNVGYLIGVVVLAVVVISILVLRHRKPVSTEANMDSFHRGLAALSPDHHAGRRRPAPYQAQPASRAGQTRVRGVPAKAAGSTPRPPSTRSKPG
jgi:hypothetical protein